MIPKYKIRIKDNKVLENLKERGYRTRVYNFQGLDLCNGDAASADYCYKYHYNDIRLIANTKVSLIDKIFLIFGHFMKPTPTTNSSQIFPIVVIKAILASFMGDRISQVPIFGSSDYDRVSPLSGMEAFEALMADVERYPRGTAFIAHILFPHYPYMYDSSCNMVKDPHKWLNVNIFTYMNGNDPMQEERKRRYYQQTRCLYSTLSKWFSKLRTTDALSGATVIMHGDHGSRICDAYPRAVSVGNPRWNQITKNCFSILFGIKAPNVSPGLSNSIKPLEQLLYQSYITPENLMSPATDDPYLLIYNETPKWPATFIRQPLEGWD